MTAKKKGSRVFYGTRYCSVAIDLGTNSVDTRVETLALVERNVHVVGFVSFVRRSSGDP